MPQDEHPTKRCRMCFQEIDRRARACPHCGQWQWRFHLHVVLPILIVTAGFVAYGEWLERRLRPRERTEQAVAYGGHIEVTQSEMLKGTSADGDTVFVVGKLHNDSDVEWEQINMEGRFFDPEGRLIDVEVEKHYLEHILPRGEMAFKIRVVADRPVDQYTGYKVFVSHAQDVRRAPW